MTLPRTPWLVGLRRSAPAAQTSGDWQSLLAARACFAGQGDGQGPGGHPGYANAGCDRTLSAGSQLLRCAVDHRGGMEAPSQEGGPPARCTVVRQHRASSMASAARLLRELGVRGSRQGYARMVMLCPPLPPRRGIVDGCRVFFRRVVLSSFVLGTSTAEPRSATDDVRVRNARASRHTYAYCAVCLGGTMQEDEQQPPAELRRRRNVATESSVANAPPAHEQLPAVEMTQNQQPSLPSRKSRTFAVVRVLFLASLVYWFATRTAASSPQQGRVLSGNRACAPESARPPPLSVDSHSAAHFVAALRSLCIFQSLLCRRGDVGGSVSRETVSFASTAELVAVADLHGDYEKTLETLSYAGIIDARGNWTGGTTHLVQTGDIVDRGRHSVKILRFMHELQVRGLPPQHMPCHHLAPHAQRAAYKPPLLPPPTLGRMRRRPPAAASPCSSATTSLRRWKG